MELTAPAKRTYPFGKVLFVAIVVVAWIAFDQWTKSLFAGGEIGQLYGSTLGGLVDFRLVHNTGAAWGIFAGSTNVLAIFSVAVCALLLVYFLVNARSINLVQCFGIGLIIAGGLGNAIDRFAQEYVTDFIAVTFIDFPIFNVADIGVTCGVVILILGLIIAWVSEPKEGEL